jgi:hypothetical protein
MSQVYDLLDCNVMLFGSLVLIAEEPAASIFRAESGRLWYLFNSSHGIT